MISSKTVEQLSNLDQVDHLSTNRTLRDGDCAVDADYFDFDDLFSSLVPVLKFGVHDQPDHRYQGEEKYFLQATGATSKGGECGVRGLPSKSMFISPFEKRLTENIARKIFADLSL